jgi:glycosyltransferase involved in cell wall biosynthesis
MRLLLVIDHFGPGGAQRQIVELARGLKRRGHQVEVFSYFPSHDFFRPHLEQEQILVHEYRKGPGFAPAVVRELSRIIRASKVQVAVSYLNSPNIYTELTKVCGLDIKVVASERANHFDLSSHTTAYLRGVVHALADHVVANSETQAAWLRRRWWLRHKVSCIYNGLDPGPTPAQRIPPSKREGMRLLAVGRIEPQKNTLNLVHALTVFGREHGYVPEVSWVGERDTTPAGLAYGRRVDAALSQAPEVRERWHWLGLQTDVRRQLERHDALIHPSRTEGLPNVVCEALAVGMPVLASNVCDHARLIADGRRGYLFDPEDPASIALAVGRLASLNTPQWQSLSTNARTFAVENLDVERMVSAYEALFRRLLMPSAGIEDRAREGVR